MSTQSFTLLYEVAFNTWGQSDPSRIGTAEPAIAKVRCWAKSADEAIVIAQRVAEIEGAQYVSTLSVDAAQGVLLERIVNDPLNPYAHDFAAKNVSDAVSANVVEEAEVVEAAPEKPILRLVRDDE